MGFAGPRVKHGPRELLSRRLSFARVDTEAAAIAVELELLRRQFETNEDFEVLARDFLVRARDDDAFDFFTMIDHRLAAREAHVDIEIGLLDRGAAAAGDGNPIAIGLTIGSRG